ncbi:MAG: HTH domain-containing protein [Atopobiaceae bacterium]|nr:HTH domain-containing protein [Atopobiaceae bacterium]
MSYERIAERLAISRRSVERAIKALRERQSIVRAGSDKPTVTKASARAERETLPLTEASGSG